MQITVIGNIPEEEVQRYVEMSKEKYKDTTIKKIILTEDGEFVDIEVEYSGVPFQRIRRITGYLVGDLSRFNNSKLKEVKDRVKHI